ncbi:MAG: hypothetical protein QOD09_817 [Bradyrhizobium sp.]|nr:hypothetical protein [Bradyrhizobium sp.]
MSNVDQSGHSAISAPRDPVINPASAGLINIMGICYLVFAILFFYLLITAWPVLELLPGNKTTFKVFNIFGIQCHWAPDRHMLFLVMMAGALGSLTHTWTSFGDYVGNRELSRNWIWFLVLRVPVGIALAVLFYFIIRGGLLIPTVQIQTPSGNSPQDAHDATVHINPYSIAAFSALAGMFSKQATDKLATVFDVLFATKKPEREGALGSSQPVKLVPPQLTRGKRENLTVTGTGFQKETTATINGKDRVFKMSTATQGVVEILDEDVRETGILKLVITNPNKDSFTTDISVVEPASAVKPVILSTDPAELTVGSNVRSLNVSGQNFQNGCKATIGNESRDTRFSDDKKITVTLLDKDLAGPGPLKLVVRNPGADGQTSDAWNITVKQQ